MKRLNKDYDLTRLQLFAGESPPAIEWIRETAWERTLEENDVLLEPGHENRSLFFVLSGSLRIELAAEHRAFVTYVNEGDCVQVTLNEKGKQGQK